jgi:D-inositol-3-phosphate glycosyltransferase
MTGRIQRVAMVSMHTSPNAVPGSGDAGGMNVAILGTAAELASRGVEVALVTRASGTPAVSPLMPGVTLHELAAGPTELPKERLGEVADEFGEAIGVLARGADGGFDILHAHYWLSGIAALPVAVELAVPFVQSFHTLATMKATNAAPDSRAESYIRERSERFLAGQADAVIAGSSAEAAAIIDGARAPADRVWVIPPGVDLDLFRPRTAAERFALRSELDLRPGRPVLAMAGRVQPLKGHELAIRALAELGAEPLLVIVGEPPVGDEPYLERLRTLSRELGVVEQVRFLGALHRERIAELFAAAQIVLVPSFSETFGLVALEAAAAGTAVIAQRAGGLVEAVEDVVTGLLIDDRDPHSWALAIERVLRDEPYRLGLEIAARERAIQFTWGATAASLLGVYASIAR